MAVTARILVGDVRERLAELPAGSVACCVTSPPYLGLRDYGIPPSVWGGDGSCGDDEHDWTENNGVRKLSPQRDNSGGLVNNRIESRGEQSWTSGASGQASAGATCRRCGAWRGCLGSEPTVDLFVAHLVEVMRGVRRVLRDDGCLWLNLGDSYSGGTQGRADEGEADILRRASVYGTGKAKALAKGADGVARKPQPGIPAKNLLGVPWTVALALRADGWWLRSALPWVKRSAMPQSVQDRPTTATETVFLLSKQKSYYWDATAVRGVGVEHHGLAGTFARQNGKNTELYVPGQRAPSHRPDRDGRVAPGRSMRDSDFWFDSLDLLIAQERAYLADLIAMRERGGLLCDEDGLPLALDVNPEAFPGSHFATFPKRLVDPLIRASTSEGGCCPACGAGWRRVMERHRNGRDWNRNNRAGGDRLVIGQSASDSMPTDYRAPTTTGWQPGCSCDAGEPVPATVLDPFSGSGTTGVVASRLGRDYIGIEISETYAAMSLERIRTEGSPLFGGTTVVPSTDPAPRETQMMMEVSS